MSLNNNEKAIVHETLNEINVLIRKWSNVFKGMKHRELRTKIFNDVSSLPVDEDRKQELIDDAAKIAQLRQPIPALGNRNIEHVVLENYSAMAHKIAYEWSNYCKKTSLTLQDMVQECFIKTFEIMYQWNAESGNLTTLLFLSLKRHMNKVINEQGCNLSHVMQSGQKLMWAFNKQKKKICNQSATNDEIIESMNLSKDDSNHLRDILRQVVNASVLTNGGDNDENSDYSCYGSESREIDENELFVQNISVKEILDMSNLSPIEREIIESSMNPYYGWQTDISKNNFSQKTGKKYHRQMITQIFESAKRKVASVMSRINAQV